MSENKRRKKFLVLAIFVSVAAFVTGVIVIAGWLFDSDILRSLLPGYPLMRVNAALAFILSGISLSMQLLRRKSPLYLWISQACALIVAAIGILTLSEYIFSWELGIDQLFFKANQGNIFTINPGRMALNTSMTFTFIGIALFINGMQKPFMLNPVILGILGSFTVGFGIMGLISYSTGKVNEAGLWNITIMAIPTAILFTLIGALLLCFAYNNTGLKISLEKSILIWFGAGLVIMLFVSTLSYRSTVESIGTEKWVNNTNNVITEITKTLSELKDVETAQRGYLLTGKESYIETFNKALNKLPSDVEKLSKLIKDNPVQHKRVEMLKALTHIKLNELQTTIRLMKTKGAEAALRIVLTDQGKQTMDKIRAICDDMMNTEYLELKTRQDKSNSIAQFNLLALPAGAFLSLFFLLASLFITNTENEKRRMAELSVLKSEERFRTLVSATSQAIWLTNAEGLVTKPMPSWQKFTGQTLNEIIGRGWANALHPDDTEKALKVWTRATEEKTLYYNEYRLKRHDGLYRNMVVRGVPVLDDGGSIYEWIGTATDVTEQKQAEEALKKAYDVLEDRVKERTAELARSNAELEQYAYVASHDLQEPLRMVTGYMKLLSKKYNNRLDEKANMYIDFALDGATRMSRLIHDLLLYSRVSTQTKEFELIDMNLILKDVLKDLHFAIKDSKVTVTSDSLPTLRADNVQMRQLLQNLIGNALKFRTMKQPEIKICSEEKSGEWLMKVIDNGIGIDPKDSERIFVIFQRLHERDKYPGTGIGLAVCKKIVELHGGRIWVESLSGLGTTFYFTIPKRSS